VMCLHISDAQIVLLPAFFCFDKVLLGTSGPFPWPITEVGTTFSLPVEDIAEREDTTEAKAA
jgi:hypothetical protein